MIPYNIIVDADDVLENLLETWVEELNERHNLNYTVEDMKEWNMSHNIKEITEEEIYDPLYDDAMWERLTPVDGAVEALELLNEMGHNVYICTRHTIFETIRTKLFRLQELFPFIPADQYIIAADKNMIKADIMVDDGVHNLASIDNPCVKILFDRPHNQHIDTDYTDLIRAKSWNEIFTIICTFSNAEVMGNWLGVILNRKETEGCGDIE